MLLKGLYHNFYLRIAVFILLTIAGTYLVLQQEWVWFVPILSVWSFFLRLVLLSDKRNAQKVAFMFDAIDNSDYAFRYATRGRSSNDKLVSESLNRITQILFQAKADAAQKEKYYELIMNCVNTGIIVLDVFRSFSEWRYLHMNRIDTIEQILAKISFLYHFL